MTGTKKLIIANWKMNGTRETAIHLARGAVACAGAGAEIVLCPSYVHLGLVADQIKGSFVKLGAQDVAVTTQTGGAQTGDVSAPILQDIGCSYVLCGHSERRARQGETSNQVRAKAAAAGAAGLTPIICVGETAVDRLAGREFEVVKSDLLGSIPAGVNPLNVVIAYEPVWAISGGDPSKPSAKLADIIAMMAFIRKTLAESLANSIGLRMLYGASVKPDNAVSILKAPHVDGVLVGGASLNSESFAAIIAAAN